MASRFKRIKAEINMRVAKAKPTIKEKSLLACSTFFSPSLIEIHAQPPDENMNPIAFVRVIKGKAMFNAASASVLTKLDTKILSTIVYKEVNTKRPIEKVVLLSNSLLLSFMVNELDIKMSPLPKKGVFDLNFL